MQNQGSQEITGRFFAAIDQLIQNKVIRGKATFCKRNEINRRVYYMLEQDNSRSLFQPSWLTALVRDYKVSPLWLLTGEGNILRSGWDFESVREFALRAKSVQPKTDESVNN